MTTLFRRLVLAAAAGLATLLPAPSARADITIVLQNEFIEQYRRRVTIDTDFLVDKAHKHPNPAKKDGDLHVAGRADQVKLPIVAEIMNAKDDPTAVETIHDAEGTGVPVKMSGAWRLWCEHAGDAQIQGQPLEPFTTTNPDHVFEIHPVTDLAGRDLRATLKPIPGFTTKDAHDAFTRYEGLRCTIVPGDDTTTLVTTMAGYNYVEFIMELNAVPEDSADGGLLVLCKVRDLDGELLVYNRRMVMVKGSEVEQKVRGKPAGTRVHVLGLPRINLSLVAWRLGAAAKGRTDVLTWSLPYEIIVVGFYNFAADEEDDPVAKKVSGPGFIPKTFGPKDIRDRLKVTLPPAAAIQLDAVPGKAAKKAGDRGPEPRPVDEPTNPKGVVPPLKKEVPDLIEER